MPEESELRSRPAREWLEAGGFASVSGRTIFATIQGEGPTLFFLHGFPTSSFDWRGAIERLRGSFRCVAFDFPGYGLSDKPDDYSYSLFQQADCAEGLAAALGLAEAHVVSHDMGTSVHCELLARAQRGELAFKILASTFTNGSMAQWRAKIMPFQRMLASNETLPQAMELCERGLPGHVDALRALMKRPEAWSAEDGEAIAELMAQQDGHLRIPALAGYMRERYVHRARWMGALDAAQDAAQIVWAAGDPIATAEMGRELHERMPRAPYAELPDAGHFLIVEAADAVAERIAEFDAAMRRRAAAE